MDSSNPNKSVHSPEVATKHTENVFAQNKVEFYNILPILSEKSMSEKLADDLDIQPDSAALKARSPGAHISKPFILEDLDLAETSIGVDKFALSFVSEC